MRVSESISYKGVPLSSPLHANVYVSIHFLHNLLNVLVKNTNQIGLQRKLLNVYSLLGEMSSKALRLLINFRGYRKEDKTI
jgi:hypothetical protein